MATSLALFLALCNANSNYSIGIGGQYSIESTGGYLLQPNTVGEVKVDDDRDTIVVTDSGK